MGKTREFSTLQLFIVLGLLFILAFAIRGHTARFGDLFGNDPFYHMRLVQEFLDTGQMPEFDYGSYARTGVRRVKELPLFHTLSVFLLQLVPMSVTDYGLLIPALLGSFTVLVSFLIGRKLFDSSSAGVFMAFLTAIMPAFVYRTTAGFAEEDFLGMVLGFIVLQLLLYARESRMHALLLGLSLSALTLTWSFSPMFSALVGLGYIVFAVEAYRKKKSLFKQGLLTFVGILPALLFLDRGSSVILSVAIIGFALIAVFFFSLLRKNKVYALLFVGLAVVGLFVFYSFFSAQYPILENISQYFELRVFFLEKSARVVGEEAFGFEHFLYKYNWSLVFIALGSLVLLSRLKGKQAFTSLFLLLVGFVSLFIAANKLKFTFVGSMGAIIVSSVGFWFVYQKAINEKKVVVSLFLVFSLLTIIGGVLVYMEAVDNVFQDLGIKQATNWINKNTPQDSRILSWWDPGHWITFNTGRKVFIDPITYQLAGERIPTIFSTSDFNEATRLIDNYTSPDYFIVTESDLKRLSSGVFHAYFIDPRKNEYKIGFYECFADSLASESVSCENITLKRSFLTQIPTQWNEDPAYSIEGTDLYIYSNPCNSYTNKSDYDCDPSFAEDNDLLYVMFDVTNQSFLVKAFFESPEVLNHYELVYRSPKVKIYKVRGAYE